MDVRRYCGLSGADIGYRGNAVPSTPANVERSNSSLDALVREITARGNDVEVRTCREGIKVFEISKKVVGVFPKD